MTIPPNPPQQEVSDEDAIAQAIYVARYEDLSEFQGQKVRAWRLPGNPPWDESPATELCEWERDEYRHEARAVLKLLSAHAREQQKQGTSIGIKTEKEITPISMGEELSPEQSRRRLEHSLCEGCEVRDREIANLKQELAGGTWSLVRQVEELTYQRDALREERDRLRNFLAKARREYVDDRCLLDWDREPVISGLSPEGKKEV